VPDAETAPQNNPDEYLFLSPDWSRRYKQHCFLKKPNKSPNPTDTHVGARVRLRRMTLGISQERLGQALGLTFQQVQKYEKGTNRIGASRLHHIAQILQVPETFLFEGAPRADHQTSDADLHSPAYISEFTSSVDGLALIKAFAKIKDRHVRRSIVALVDQIGGPGHAGK
jgi:transcriptional regulator with XRE-family HTH domain